MNKKVLVSGVTGQAGSYFSDYLLKNTDYEIYGMIRRLSVKNHENIKHLENNPRFHLFSGDLNDSHSIFKNIEEIKPNYFINCAAQSFVFESWITPANTFEVDCVAIIHILEAIRKIKPSCRFINFGSSEEMGDVQYSPQDEKHPPRARSIYGAAKIASRQIIKVYRESYQLYCVQSWNYNYESERRGEEFVTRKITQNVARIYNSLKNNKPFDSCKLGSLDSQRDWSHAEDIIDGTWRMINQELYRDDILKPRTDILEFGNKELINESKSIYLNTDWLKEYIFSSGKCYSIKDFVEKSFSIVEIKGNWIGNGLSEKYINENNNVLVEVDPKFFRPADVKFLQGNSNEAKKDLKWVPKISFDKLIERMVLSDIKKFELFP